MIKMFGDFTWRQKAALDQSETIRAEIFGTDRFRQHARSLAESQKISKTPQRAQSLIKRLDDNEQALLVAYRDVLAAVQQGKALTPAAEWLIDNYSLVEQHIRQTRADLPAGFYRELPKLADGHLAGQPRIFGLVWAYVAHNDSQFDPDTLADFVNEYQKVQPLKIGELWAVAISLRLILIENIRRISQRIMNARQQREAADRVADALLGNTDLKLTTRQILDDKVQGSVAQTFAVQFIQRVRDHSEVSNEALDWLQAKLEHSGQSLESVVSDEHHRQSTGNVTVRNIITSMRLISDVNWETWFDSVSLVDHLLRTHPTYGAMDFPSRTLYRTAVEDLARGSDLEELVVAQRSLDNENPEPGFYLLGPGRQQFENTLQFRAKFSSRVQVAIKRQGLVGYLAGIGLVTVAVLALSTVIFLYGFAIPVVALLLAMLFLPATEFAVATVNFVVTRMIQAYILPGLALREGVTADLRTLVVIPTLLTSRDEIEDLIERLEVHFLSNAEGEIYFALVTDWTDATTESQPNDQELLDAALSGIETLNKRHGTNRFFLLHRHRKWNEQQNRWMGWERKRGKLQELNRLLRGATDTSFTTLSARLPEDFRYVITLDADTRLPREAARRLVGKIAHPLNQPRFDKNLGRVTQGYGVLQPRVTPSLPVGHYGSTFQRIFSTARGIDPYTFAVSDVYQDLFEEGSFAGKGIYDIDVFEAALKNKIPENTMLSHDLFEGTFARAALVTDVEVVEEYPERYSVAAARQHRWTRGDWQLLPWFLGRRPTAIPILGKWKMTDNLRRSLIPLFTLLSLFAGWWLLPFNAALNWTVLIVLLQLVPSLLPAVSSAIPRAHQMTTRSRFKTIQDDFAQAITLTLCTLLFLAHQTALMGDAIVRTLYRLTVSRKQLLEWTTAAQSAAGPHSTLLSSYQLMMSSVVCALLALAVAYCRGSEIWMVASPFALAWFLAPAVASWISQTDLVENVLATMPEDRKALRLVARRTWRFFETFVTAQDNMLPPDNFQETPKPVVAHRTSPTNIGLYLLSVVSAHQFGWIGLGDAVSRIEATLATVKRLEKYQGHLYNWYDTTDLRTLDPKYVSTVDSGNLAGHLIALSNYCSHWITHPTNPQIILDGVEDALSLLLEQLADIPNDRRLLRPMRKQIEQQVAGFRQNLKAAAATPEIISMRLVAFSLQASNLYASVLGVAEQLNTPEAKEVLQWASLVRSTVESHFNDASRPHSEIKKRLEILASESHAMAMAMEFDFLLDPRRQLLSIGYRVNDAARDESCYDMLASECRLGSYFAIAKGDLRTRHWFRLARPVTAVNGGAALVSWSGSMFEYLMPLLVMRSPSGGLLDQTAHLIVERQISYAASHGVPWGISEAAFNARDIEFSYQYSNFGVPGLGLKRGLPDDMVIAPYATGLAAMVAPFAAVKNYQRLASKGGRGIYGFYESIDFTPSRLRPDQTMAVVQAYFAHHQGMTIVALLNAVNDGEMRDRFHAEPMVRATELLLQERAPREVPVSNAQTEALAGTATTRDSAKPMPRIFISPANSPPITHLLSNGQYHVMITASGSGYSMWNGQAITRWREDAVLDDWGSFIYIRDTRSGKLWSAGHAPTIVPADNFVATFSEEKAEFSRSDANCATTLECVVSPEDNAEVRRITISNRGRFTREIDVTTYTELVLAPAAADDAHPVFSKLFIETEFVADYGALVATRRRRSPTEPAIWVAQFILFQANLVGDVEYETDRGLFLGRGNTTRAPSALTSNAKLSGTVGYVLDPIFSLRQRLRIPPGKQARGTLWTMVADSREGVLDLVDRHRQSTAYDRAGMLAWTQAQIQLRHLAISNDDANLYQTLASHMIYANDALRTPSKIIAQDLGPQSALWPQSISGDRPILLLRIDDIEDIAILEQILRAFEYWKAKGLIADLVILNDRMSSYVQDLQTAIDALVRKVSSLRATNQVYLIRADLTSPDTLRVVTSAARVVFHARRGTLADQMGRLRQKLLPIISPRAAEPSSPEPALSRAELEFFNGYGGFANDGREYVTIVQATKPTPAPWVNVIANPQFGFHASAESCGFTWFGNARENQMTPWNNDPVTNEPAEVFYVQDLKTGVLMSPTLAPLKSQEGTHLARHGFGFTVYERAAHGLHMELLQTVPLHDSIKISRLKVTNRGNASVSLNVTFYADWVLGRSRAASAPFVVTAIDEQTGSMFARNPWRNQEGRQVAFADMAGKQTTWTADRQEFLGMHGSLANPRGLAGKTGLSMRVGAGFDPCCALQTTIEIGSGQSADIVILFGAAESNAEAARLLTQYRSIPVEDILNDVKTYWHETLNAVQVKTPDRSFDIIMNGWLQYQTLACRMWARCGFYQASGAYGFRDQLQDSMAVLNTRPELAREHILRAASRQFVQGDFQHWWLPATGMGVRTRISDDNVWLSYCVNHYLQVTGDTTILDENVAFIEGQALEPGQHDAFFLPHVAEETATLYEHCARALDLSLATGAHGLPLFGTGDWNDGMNRVGEGGKGESIWLGWFLLHTLKAFSARALTRGDRQRSDVWAAHYSKLNAAMETHGWDGNWYRRGYFDDGTPLGSSQNDECRIDAIAQSWAVISGVGDKTHAATAMEQSYVQLVKPAYKLVQLFTPPFADGKLQPGYIKAYPPGIRENGGQYTHGVLWSIFAHATLGQHDRAHELFAMMNPVNHTRTPGDVAVYRVEPYVMAADVYTAPSHMGRGGWTWYTGSAGWMYRAGLEAILGVTRESDTLRIKPSLPSAWSQAEVEVQFGRSRYCIRMVRGATANAALPEGIRRDASGEYFITLTDTDADHFIEIAV